MQETSTIVFRNREGRGRVHHISGLSAFLSSIILFTFSFFRFPTCISFLVPCLLPLFLQSIRPHVWSPMLQNKYRRNLVKLGLAQKVDEQVFYPWKPTIAYIPWDLNIESFTLYPHVVCVFHYDFYNQQYTFLYNIQGLLCLNANAPCSYVIYELNLYMYCI